MEDPGKNKGIASLVLGIIGVVSCWYGGFGMIFGIIALILAIMSGNSSQAAGLKRSGMATAGLILGIITIVLGIPTLICTLACAGYAGLGSCAVCAEMLTEYSSYT